MRVKIAIAAAISVAASAMPAQAQENYLGQIVVTAATFCPRGTLPADGRLLSISEHTALFALMGTTYGGDGRTTFALPNLEGALMSQNKDDFEAEVRHCVVTVGIFPSRD